MNGQHSELRGDFQQVKYDALRSVFEHVHPVRADVEFPLSLQTRPCILDDPEVAQFPDRGQVATPQLF